MFYVDPSIKEKFDSLSPDLRAAISSKNVQLNTIQDLIRCLEEIVAEAED